MDKFSFPWFFQPAAGNFIMDNAPAPAKSPEFYFNLTTACLEKVQAMISRRDSTDSLKFNHEQCKDLVETLRMAVQSASSFLGEIFPTGPESLSSEEMAQYLEMFKLLFASAKQVESFIRGCCKLDARSLAAVVLPNLAEHMPTVDFDLKSCIMVFDGATRTLTSSAAASVSEVEQVHPVEKSYVVGDKETLLTKVKALIDQSSKSGGDECLLTQFVLARLEGSPSKPMVWHIDPRSLQHVKRLGSGAAGVYVDEATWLGVRVAKKTFVGPVCPQFEMEVAMLARLCHPNIISLFCVATSDRSCSMIMEVMDEDLFRLIQTKVDGCGESPPFSDLESVGLMLQVARGMLYLHDNKVVHRDLKSHNILVNHVTDQVGLGYVHAKVADFGLSKTKESSTHSNQTANVGTNRWMAPEVIQFSTMQGSRVSRLKYNPFKSDVYSFGMVCYEIWTGQVPFSWITSAVEVKRRVLIGERPMIPERCPDELRALLEKCWLQIASSRPGFAEICKVLTDLKLSLMLGGRNQVSVSEQVSSEGKVVVDRFAENPNALTDLILSEMPGGRNQAIVSEQVSSEGNVVVGLDFGTDFSGYAFAHTSDPSTVLTFYDWPRASRSSCKTLSAIYYESSDGATARVKSWGFPALIAHLKEINIPRGGPYLTRFKDHLASRDSGKSSSAASLPTGFTVVKVVSDYLRMMGAYIMLNLRTRFGDQLTMESVQWFVTVPSSWDIDAKERMKECMARAGLIRSALSPMGSPHPLNIVLEAEAASCYCRRNVPDLELKAGDRLLVADIGGTNAYIVVQEWISETADDFRVEEIACSTGGLSGRSYVDSEFFKYLFSKIPCLPQFLQRSPDFWRVLARHLDEFLCSFGDIGILGESFEIQIPSQLAAEWEKFDEEIGNPPRESYDDLELTHGDMKAIFDPVVAQIIHIMANQLSSASNVEVIFVVGSFAVSPYLLSRIKEAFLGQVQRVISPINPESAVCQGAVLLAFNHSSITS